MKGHTHTHTHTQEVCAEAERVRLLRLFSVVGGASSARARGGSGGEWNGKGRECQRHREEGDGIICEYKYEKRQERGGGEEM